MSASPVDLEKGRNYTTDSVHVTYAIKDKMESDNRSVFPGMPPPVFDITHPMLKGSAVSSGSEVDDQGELDQSELDEKKLPVPGLSAGFCEEDQEMNFGLPERGRKRKWKKHIRVEKRLKGESYTGFRDVEHAARPMLPSPCIGRNKHQCSSLVSEDHRRKIYETFRTLSSVDNQRTYIAHHVNNIPKKRTTKDRTTKRVYTRVYTLTVGHEKVQVCREFFLATLNITEALVRSSLRKKTDTGTVEPDMRGRHVPSNKLSPQTDEYIRKFIFSFTTVESQKCRKSSSKIYLDATLNISKLHRMFLDSCVKDGMEKVSFDKFRIIFRRFNLGFSRPKKDQCKKCLVYCAAACDEKPVLLTGINKPTE